MFKLALGKSEDVIGRDAGKLLLEQAGVSYVSEKLSRLNEANKIALLASLFLALSPTFFFFNGIMLTEIVSTFFALAAIYFSINENYLFSGILFGLSFMTRFLQLFTFISLILVFLIHYNKKNTRNGAIYLNSITTTKEYRLITKRAGTSRIHSSFKFFKHCQFLELTKRRVK